MCVPTLLNRSTSRPSAENHQWWRGPLECSTISIAPGVVKEYLGATTPAIRKCGVLLSPPNKHLLLESILYSLRSIPRLWGWHGRLENDFLLFAFRSTVRAQRHTRRDVARQRLFCVASSCQ